MTMQRTTIHDPTARRSPVALPAGMLLHGQYEVGRILGRLGGFGITYLCWDTNLEVPVAIKEYLPRHLAMRGTDRSQVVADGENRKLFQFGLEQFLGEARTVAGFSHPNIVRVRTSFQENATAYLVMDYYEGLTLDEYVQTQPGSRLPQRSALAILMPIMDALRSEVHAKGYLHRDVKPQNIYLTQDRVPILLDFGAARVSLGAQSGSVNSVLTPGYAPFEQYLSQGQRRDQFREGTWTDVYGTAATLYRLVTGQQPPAAPDRHGGTELEPPGRLARDVSPAFSQALMAGMALQPTGRLQTIETLQRRLAGTDLVRKKAGLGAVGRRLVPAAAVVATLMVILGLYKILTLPPNRPPRALSDMAVTARSRPVEIAVLANDLDPDGDKLTLESVDQPQEGVVTWDVSGAVVYTPNGRFLGEERFSYTMTDGVNRVRSEVAVRIEGDDAAKASNSAPVAADDRAITVAGNPVEIPILANDWDPDSDSLTIVSLGEPENGRLSDNGDGTLTYTPHTGFVGLDQFPYVVGDGEALDGAEVIVEVIVIE